MPTTITDHVVYGNTLKAFEHALEKIPTHKLHIIRKYLPVKEALSNLKNVLDNQVHFLVPIECDPRKLSTKVYYGPPLIKNTETKITDDAFADWMVG